MCADVSGEGILVRVRLEDDKAVIVGNVGEGFESFIARFCPHDIRIGG
jgi:hypothetical protein